MLPNHHIKTAATLALALGAIAPAAASARPIGPDPVPWTASQPTPIVRVITTPSSGFDWGDAGIGAAGGLAIAMLGVGGTLVLSQRRARHAHRPAVPTS
jgi:hypothetical protein